MAANIYDEENDLDRLAMRSQMGNYKPEPGMFTTPNTPPSGRLEQIGGGIMAPGDMKVDQPLGPRNYQQEFMDATKGLTGSPQEKYRALKEALSPKGFEFQENSDNLLRGRVKAPDRNVYDTWLNEANDAGFLGDGQGVTGDFGWLKRGHESESDGGGWSFGGGPARGASPLIAGNQGLSNFGDEGFFQQLLAEAQRQAGPTDNDSIRALLGIR